MTHTNLGMSYNSPSDIKTANRKALHGGAVKSRFTANYRQKCVYKNLKYEKCDQMYDIYLNEDLDVRFALCHSFEGV